MENTEPVSHWKDPRASVKGPAANAYRCGACKKTLPAGNKRKAINHWSGVSNDPTATIARCFCPEMIPGLVEFAKRENAAYIAMKSEKELAAKLQSDLDSTKRSEEMREVASSLASAAPGNSTCTNQTQLNWHSSDRRALDLAIEKHIIEDGMTLDLPKKEAFREMIGAAIKYGARTKGSAYKMPGRKRVQGELLDDTLGFLDRGLETMNEGLKERDRVRPRYHPNACCCT